ncbi:MAG: hypothetical protein ABIA37_02655 [Candidatus Woesearchaeota archaeon]
MAGKKPETETGFDLSKVYIWIRGVESKTNNLRREIDVIKNDSAKKYDKMSKEIKTINTELMELKREREKFNEKLDLIIKELRLTAGKDELMTLKKYLDLWNPLNFVTQRDVERVIEQKLAELKEKSKKVK